VTEPGIALYVFSVPFQKKHLLWDKAKTKNCSYKTALHSLLQPQWYQTWWTPANCTLRKLFVFISVTEPGIALYVFSVPFQKNTYTLGQSKDKKLLIQDSHLHSLLRHQWYQTGGPLQIGL